MPSNLSSPDNWGNADQLMFRDVENNHLIFFHAGNHTHNGHLTGRWRTLREFIEQKPQVQGNAKYPRILRT